MKYNHFEDIFQNNNHNEAWLRRKHEVLCLYDDEKSDIHQIIEIEWYKTPKPDRSHYNSIYEFMIETVDNDERNYEDGKKNQTN